VTATEFFHLIEDFKEIATSLNLSLTFVGQLCTVEGHVFQLVVSDAKPAYPSRPYNTPSPTWVHTNSGRLMADAARKLRKVSAGRILPQADGTARWFLHLPNGESVVAWVAPQTENEPEDPAKRVEAGGEGTDSAPTPQTPACGQGDGNSTPPEPAAEAPPPPKSREPLFFVTTTGKARSEAEAAQPTYDGQRIEVCDDYLSADWERAREVFLVRVWDETQSRQPQHVRLYFQSPDGNHIGVSEYRPMDMNPAHYISYEPYIDLEGTPPDANRFACAVYKMVLGAETLPEEKHGTVVVHTGQHPNSVINTFKVPPRVMPHAYPEKLRAAPTNLLTYYTKEAGVYPFGAQTRKKPAPDTSKGGGEENGGGQPTPPTDPAPPPPASSTPNAPQEFAVGEQVELRESIQRAAHPTLIISGTVGKIAARDKECPDLYHVKFYGIQDEKPMLIPASMLGKVKGGLIERLAAGIKAELARQPANTPQDFAAGESPEDRGSKAWAGTDPLRLAERAAILIHGANEDLGPLGPMSEYRMLEVIYHTAIKPLVDKLTAAAPPNQPEPAPADFAAGDIYTQAAASMLHKSAEQITKEERDAVKTLIHAIPHAAPPPLTLTPTAGYEEGSTHDTITAGEIGHGPSANHLSGQSATPTKSLRRKTSAPIPEELDEVANPNPDPKSDQQVQALQKEEGMDVSTAPDTTVIAAINMHSASEPPKASGCYTRPGVLAFTSKDAVARDRADATLAAAIAASAVLPFSHLRPNYADAFKGQECEAAKQMQKMLEDAIREGPAAVAELMNAVKQANASLGQRKEAARASLANAMKDARVLTEEEIAGIADEAFAAIQPILPGDRVVLTETLGQLSEMLVEGLEGRVVNLHGKDIAVVAFDKRSHSQSVRVDRLRRLPFAPPQPSPSTIPDFEFKVGDFGRWEGLDGKQYKGVIKSTLVTSGGAKRYGIQTDAGKIEKVDEEYLTLIPSRPIAPTPSPKFAVGDRVILTEGVEVSPDWFIPKGATGRIISVTDRSSGPLVKLDDGGGPTAEIHRSLLAKIAPLSVSVINPDWSEAEREAIARLAKDKDMSPQGVLRQALRSYQQTHMLLTDMFAVGQRVTYTGALGAKSQGMVRRVTSPTDFRGQALTLSDLTYRVWLDNGFEVPAKHADIVATPPEPAKPTEPELFPLGCEVYYKGERGTVIEMHREWDDLAAHARGSDGSVARVLKAARYRLMMKDGTERIAKQHELTFNLKP
jgi:hypothetical protein